LLKVVRHLQCNQKMHRPSIYQLLYKRNVSRIAVHKSHYTLFGFKVIRIRSRYIKERSNSNSTHCTSTEEQCTPSPFIFPRTTLHQHNHSTTSM